MKFRWFLLIGATLGVSAVMWAALSALPVAWSQAPPSGTVSGVVIDAAGPVAGATVRVRATDLFTTTDAEGCFTLTNLPLGEAVDLTAWAPGYYITGGREYLSGADDVVLILIPHAAVDNADYDWLSAFASAGDASNCENCHASAQASAAAALPFDEWAVDAHAQSAHNPRFLSMYAGTDLAGNQSPLTRYGYSRDYGRFPLRPDPTQPYYGPGYKLDFPATAGNCTACHAPAAAINAPYSTDPTLVSGVGTEGVTCDFCHKIWDVRLSPDTGLPYANMPGVLSLDFRRPPEGHQFFAGPYDDVGFAGSEDTYSPVQTESAFCAACHFGTFWDTTIYNSFGEWLASPYSDPVTGKTCQDCHMPPLGATRVADHEQAMERDPATIFSHQMPGAADENLLQNTAELQVTAEQVGGQVIVTVAVTNTGAGHHIPTDSPLRQIILVVTATDAQGNALSQVEGPVLPSWAGDLQGAPGIYFAKILQEIWTEVSPTGAYWNPTRIVEDTRLPALDTNTSTYAFAAPEGAGTVTVEARLIFRRAFYDLMQQKGWDIPDIVMERQTATLP
jgi:nitrate/TMAO reductase-like tetraheme cytochrome c subunit